MTYSRIKVGTMGRLTTRCNGAAGATAFNLPPCARPVERERYTA